MQQISLAGVPVWQSASLAPMASVADRAYRVMCKRYGAAMVTGELASAKGLCYSDRKTRELLFVSAEEEPMAVQLFGSEPEFMVKAAKIAATYHPQWIDINMGCPVHKVVSTGAGSALLKTPQLAYEIVARVADAVSIPVTVKMRRGYEAGEDVAVPFALKMEEAGAAALTVHGRTRSQMYQPSADWSCIRAVKEAVKIPVVGNGDVTSPELAQKMYEETGCDLVMIGRGSYGRPWIFEEVNAYLKDGVKLPPKSMEERLEILKEHVALMQLDKPERIVFCEARKLIGWYLKGFPQAAHFRGEANTIQNYEDFTHFLKKVRQVQQDCQNIENPSAAVCGIDD